MDVTLAVARTGDCLNFQAEPSANAQILDCLPDGTRLTVRDSDHRLGDDDRPGPLTAFWPDDDTEPSQSYVHVSRADRRVGWVAIQYLDWAPVAT